MTQTTMVFNQVMRQCKKGNLGSCEILYMETKISPRGELIIGGKADGRKDDEFSKDQLLKGISVELEHTNDPWIAKEITKDHLVEEAEIKGIDPRDSVYYDYLERMESAWKNKKRERNKRLCHLKKI